MERTVLAQRSQNFLGLNKPGRRAPLKAKLKQLSEQVMVITGASSGIGLSTARMAARRGAKLLLIARNEEALKELTRELRDVGCDAMHCVADVGHEAELRHAAESAIERFGRIDTWVNNAGVGIFGRNEDVSREDQRQLFETNFWGVVHGSLIAARLMKVEGGAIINIGSGFSDRAAPLQGIYSASKHAVKGFTESLRMELEEEGAPLAITLIKPASIASTFLANAKNYLDVHPTLPPPIYAPDLVASAILYAAEHPRRDLYVGGGAKILGVGAYFFPRMLDLGMKHLMFPLQRTNKPPRPRELNNLYSAGNCPQERTHVYRRVRETSVYTTVVTHPKALRALGVTGCIGLAAAWWARQSKAATRPESD